MKTKVVSEYYRVAIIASALATSLVGFAGKASAAVAVNTGNVQNYTDAIIQIVNNMLVPALMAIAMLVFLYGVYNYFILGSAEEKSREDGRKFTLWGIIGFVVILSVWAIVKIVAETAGLELGDGSPNVPTFNVSEGSNRFGPSGTGN